jgi:hypothetical protein
MFIAAHEEFDNLIDDPQYESFSWLPTGTFRDVTAGSAAAPNNRTQRFSRVVLDWTNWKNCGPPKVKKPIGR